MQGIDLFAGEANDRVMFAEEDHEGNQLRSVRFREGDDDWTFIEANEANPRGLAPRELYELLERPGRAHEPGGVRAAVD